MLFVYTVIPSALVLAIINTIVIRMQNGGEWGMSAGMRDGPISTVYWLFLFYLLPCALVYGVIGSMV
jgi:hypothetical protein